MNIKDFFHFTQMIKNKILILRVAKVALWLSLLKSFRLNTGYRSCKEIGLRLFKFN